MPKNWVPDGNPMPGLKTLKQRVAYVARIRASFEEKAATFAHKLASGDIRLDTWERYMRREIRAMHTASLIIARGGDPKSITDLDIKTLNATIKDQYKYLRNFKIQAGARAYLVETGQGDFFSEQYLVNRSRLYGGPSGATFYRAFAFNLLPQVPRDGQTACKVNCRCELRFVQSSEPEVIHVFWELRPAEHCDDCVALAAAWKPYVLRLPEGLSAADWVRWLPKMRAHEVATGGYVGPGVFTLGRDRVFSLPRAVVEAANRAMRSIAEGG